MLRLLTARALRRPETAAGAALPAGEKGEPPHCGDPPFAYPGEERALDPARRREYPPASHRGALFAAERRANERK